MCIYLRIKILPNREIQQKQCREVHSVCGERDRIERSYLNVREVRRDGSLLRFPAFAALVHPLTKLWSTPFELTKHVARGIGRKTCKGNPDRGAFSYLFLSVSPFLSFSPCRRASTEFRRAHGNAGNPMMVLFPNVKIHHDFSPVLITLIFTRYRGGQEIKTRFQEAFLQGNEQREENQLSRRNYCIVYLRSTRDCSKIIESEATRNKFIDQKNNFFSKYIPTFYKKKKSFCR